MCLRCQVKILNLRKIRLAIVKEDKLGDKLEDWGKRTVKSLFQWSRSVTEEETGRKYYRRSVWFGGQGLGTMNNQKGFQDLKAWKTYPGRNKTV